VQIDGCGEFAKDGATYALFLAVARAVPRGPA
jgi:hypothetical protein